MEDSVSSQQMEVRAECTPGSRGPGRWTPILPRDGHSGLSSGHCPPLQPAPGAFLLLSSPVLLVTPQPSGHTTGGKTHPSFRRKPGNAVQTSVTQT